MCKPGQFCRWESQFWQAARRQKLARAPRLGAARTRGAHRCARVVPNRSLVDGDRLPASQHFPVFGEDRPEVLVEVFAVSQEGLAQHTFAHRTDFAERAVAAAVSDSRTCLEAMHADRLEREVEN